MKVRYEGVKRTSPQPTGGPFKRGVVFRHGKILDPGFVPGPGQRYADAPKALCRVTAIRRGMVFYGIGPDASKAHYCAAPAMLLRDGALLVEEFNSSSGGR